MPHLKGLIFDLDGTLVDSRLNFDLMRAELEIPGRQPVLEFVEALPEGPSKKRAREVLLTHEMRGAREATLMPGIDALLKRLDHHTLHQGILTRNLRVPTELTLQRLGLRGFSQIVTREDAPPKPDPTGLLQICRQWGCAPDEVVFIGDYRFDLLAGQNAGIKTILYAAKALPEYAVDADWVIEDFETFASEFETVFCRKLGFNLATTGSF